MVNQREKAQMKDYIMDHLAGCGETLKYNENFVYRYEGGRQEIPCNNIQVGNDGLVLLGDKTFPNEGLAKIVDIAGKIGKTRIAPILFKDGKTYFRNGANGNGAGVNGIRYKQQKNLSLSEYTPEQVNRMINFRPEEKFLQIRNMDSEGKFGWIQYYQPESAELPESIECIPFKNVTYDLSYLPAGEIFGPTFRDSEKIFMWDNTKRKHFTGQLKLERRFLKQFVQPIVAPSLATMPDASFTIPQQNMTSEEYLKQYEQDLQNGNK